jgi:hypothetical protein
LWLDDFAISTEAVPARSSVREGPNGLETVLDDFESGPLRWVVLGPGRIGRDAKAPAGGAAALRMDYEVGNALTLLATQFAAPESSASPRSLALDVRVSQPTTLALGLVERDKSSYITVFHVPDAAWHRVELPLAEFRLDVKSPQEMAAMPPKKAAEHVDENAHLDVDQVNALHVLDLGSVLGASLRCLACSVPRPAREHYGSTEWSSALQNQRRPRSSDRGRPGGSLCWTRLSRIGSRGSPWVALQSAPCRTMWRPEPEP